MGSLTVDFVQFPSTIANFFIFGKETGHKVIPALDFEIFLKFPHFLRFEVLSNSATCKATPTFSFWG